MQTIVGLNLCVFTDLCQVAMLNEENIASLLKQTHIPVNKSHMVFQNQELPILPSSWFPLIWGYINRYGILQNFEELPLIPFGTEKAFKEVAILHRGSFIIHYEKDEEDGVISLLRHLGCTIVKELPSYVCQNRSVFECKYIYGYKDEDLLQLLSNLSSKLGQDEVIRKFLEFSGKKVKLDFFRKVSHFSVKDSMQTLIKSLPFIENTSNERLISVDECQLIAPRELPDVMPQRMLLKIEHKVQVSFIEKLGGKQLSKREFIEEILLPEINKSKVQHGSNQSMIQYILHSIAVSNDRQHWQEVINALSCVQFVQSDDEKFYKPIELFRRCERLESLFVGEKGRFPNIGQNLEVLKLKNDSDVSADDIRQSLRPIYDMENIRTAHDKARCILEHLERNCNLLYDERLINEMSNTAWIPINKERPDAYPDSLTWYGEKNLCSFGKPAEMTTKKNSKLVGTVRAVISSDIEDFKAIRLTMKCSQLNHQDVLDQLLNVIDKFDCNDKHKLMIILDEIYRYLEDKWKEFTPDQLERLKCERWVWCGNCFVKPQQIVLKSHHLDMRPYIYDLPQDLSEMNSLLETCGSVAEIEKDSLIHVLKSIQEEHKHHTNKQEDVDRDRRICVEVLKDLGHMRLSDDDLNRILVPIRCEDAELLLEISTRTVYSSIGGFNCEEEEEGEEDLIFLHECITDDIVEGLHIRSLTSQRIGAEDLGVEEFGQHEPLTRRINRLLVDYGDGLAIIKELIQNADDAGAVEIKFLYDERLNNDKQKYLIDPGMKDVQGPALWAYNDAKFSKEDFENIVKLSGATKEDKRDKIGKFGLGFNAVYNITDVPSFISDNQLVILDPHTTHLGHAIKNKSKPGVKIPLGPKRNRLRGFQDQIRIYDGVFGMDASLSDGYKLFEGTLFRFPLRTERQAQMSEIKTLYYSKDEIRELIRKFAIEANRLLMFTQNVRTVEFFHLAESTENAESMRHILHVSKKISSPSIDTGYLKANYCQSFDIMKQASHAVEHTASGKQGIFFERGLRHAVEIATNAQEGLKEFFEIESKYKHETWLIHSYIDDNECMNMALKSPQLNPVASVAVCIEKSKDGKIYRLLPQQSSNPGHFYCFLPLPIPNGLNVHINSTFALSKDRKSFQEWSEDDKMHDTLETIWNRNLMSGPVSSAYIGLLKDLTNLIDLEDEATWYSLWPQNDVVSSNTLSYRQELIRSFYRSIIKDHVCVFPNSRSRNRWLNWTQIMTIEGSVRNMKNGNVIERMMEDVVYSFHKEKIVVHIPEQLLSTLGKSGFQNELLMIVLSFPTFFVEIFMPIVKKRQISLGIIEVVLIFAIQNYSPDLSVSNAIKECECIPTQPSGGLRKPLDLVKPMSKAADLFEIDDQVFPLETFEDCYGNLMKLGMLSDNISSELLIDRAKTVDTLGDSKKDVAEKRVRKIIQLLEERISQTGDDGPSDLWESVKFLPAKPRPPKWLLLNCNGMQSREGFASAGEMYPGRLENVVGCHKLVIDNDIAGTMSPAVEKLLGIRTQVTVNDIMSQIDSISECIKNREESELPEALPEVFDMIYKTLWELLSKGSLSEVEIQEIFKGTPVILTNKNTLVYSKQVAFRLMYNAEPYLYNLPNRFAMSYRLLMTALGVKETFNMEDYNGALTAMERHAGGSPLNDSQLNTVRDLLESIDNKRAPKPSDIFLPDKGKVLRKKDSVVVKERVWMRNDPTKRYLHDRIPPQLALSLGAKTERSQSIASQSRGLPFGQHEKLTVRLKRILEAYPSQIQILYELLQNADDAGASEVKFVLDKRQHPDEKVFGDAWKSLQGPALLVFNDAPFTNRDIEGIQNLGEGSKSDDCQKTGQYGIGFNVVYHVTDAPCLLTRVEDDSVLCIFDPHARFLEECSEAEPGRMFENGREYLKNTFPDIYNTFLPGFLTNEESAILRLPLRSSSHALNSSIKQRATTTEEILEMFQSFKDKGPEAIIFLRNVKSVELISIEDTLPTEEPHCVFSVHADMTDESRNALSSFNEDYKSLSSSIGNRLKSNKKYLPFQNEISLRTGKEGDRERTTKRKWHKVKEKDCGTKWRIIQKCASINPEDLPQSLDDQYKNGKLPLIPVGGIAHKIDGAPIDGKVYCLLPLAISSSLPLHMNGKFILDYESRRRLWYTNEDSFQKTWNYYVIEHCIVPCYVQLLRTLAHERNFLFGKRGRQQLLENALKINGIHPKQIEAYFCKFPKLRLQEKAHEYEADLIKTLYQRLASKEINVLPVLRPSSKAVNVEFFPPNSKIRQFHYIPFSDKKTFIEHSSKICIALLKLGMNIYKIPADIVDSFRESGVPLKKLTPGVVKEFLRSNAETVMEGKEQLTLKYSVFGNITTVEALLQYCAKCENFSLNGLPLLVTEDEELRQFDESKYVYYDEVSTLFPSRAYMTLHPKLRTTLVRFVDKMSGALRKFMLHDFSRVIREELRTDFKMNDEISVADVTELEGILPREDWLRCVWKFLRERFEEWKLSHINEEYIRVMKKRAGSFRNAAVTCRTPKEMGLVPMNFLGQISEWCLFPVERHITGKHLSKQYSLMRIYKACNVVAAGTGMNHVVNGLGLPVPSSLLVDDHKNNVFDNSNMLMGMATSIEDVNAFIAALTVESTRDESGFQGVSTKIATELLRLLSRKSEEISWIRQESLKNLPVWEDLSGELKTISSAANCYLIGYKMPKDGTSFLQNRCNVLLLKKHPDLQSVYEKVALKTQNDAEVYSKLILQHFSELQPEDRIAHLSYLKDKCITSVNLEPALIEKLKSTRIIEKNGKLLYAKDFYDPDIKLFSIMLLENDFPPKDFKGFSWLHFLRLLGLITTVSSDLFCEFATKISQTQDKDERRRKSSALIEHFRESEDLKNDTQFLNLLSSIPFLVADKLNVQLSRIHPGKTEEGMVCFNDSVLHSDRNIMLSWTVENTIPSYASKSQTHSNLPYDGLSAKREVSISSVARNLENISKSDLLRSVAEGVKTYTKCEKFDVIFDTAYEYFHKRRLLETEEAFSVLCSIPIILVNGNMISMAKKVTMEKEFDMPPYLFSMNVSLGKFVDFFKKMGMSEKPTIHQLTKVLDGLFFASKKNSLGPNEANNCLKVIVRLMDLIDEDGFPDDISLIQLPGCYGMKKSTVCLFQSQDLVYYDDEHLEKRLTKLDKPRLHLDFMRERVFSHKDKLSPATVSRFITNLPLVLQPKMIRTVVKEVIVDAATIPNFGFTKDLQTVMKCIEFAECMIRLLKHQEDGCSDEDKADIEKTSELLPRIEVITKESVRTVLVLQSNCEKVDGSEYESEVFAAVHEERLEIYVSSSLTKKSDTIAAVASALVSFFKFKDPKLSPLINALLEKEPREMHEYLDKQRIGRSAKDMAVLGSLFYSLGGYVPIELHCLLVNDISIFKVGDYVAYEVEDPGLDENDGDPVYIYAKVLECITRHTLNDFYKIDIGVEEPKIVHKSELYGFYRPDNFQEDSEDGPLNAEKVKESIRRELEEAFKHGKEYAKRILKRLWLRWHPDKNIGNEEFCTEIFIFIQAEVMRLEGNSKKHFWNSESAYRRYHQRGSMFGQQQSNFKKDNKGYSWSSGYWRAPNHSKNPQPGEAKRWFRQAKFDLEAARSDMAEENYEWLCFKCHQVCVECISSFFLFKVLLSLSVVTRSA